ncbi:MAG TPA: VRR-NUC domain-containing protein [Dissulfurispiraceae bacterium]|nr:VRR-NUC domain-containing protein [Dissulfurispiraceae bacterium]
MKQLSIDGKPRVPTETEIRKQVRDYLRWRGWTVFHHMGGPLSHKGLSDLQALKSGRCLFIEIKRPGGRQSEAQCGFHAQVEAAGFEYILCRSVDDLQKKGI